MTLRIPLRLIGALLLGFFIAGAVIFPVLHNKFFTILFSFGLAGLAYGIESVLSFGQVNECSLKLFSFASSSCMQHSVRPHGVALSIIIFGWFTYRDNRAALRTGSSRVPVSSNTRLPLLSTHGELFSEPEIPSMSNQQVSELIGLLDNFRRVSGDGAARYNADAIAKFARTVERPWSRKTLQGHLTSSAWVLDITRTHAALVHHRKLDRWLQPGGHIDDGDVSWRSAAEREAWEETGLRRFLPHPTQDALFDADVHEIPARADEPAHTHYDLRFLLVAEVDATHANVLQTNAHESNDCQWFALTALAADPQLEPSIRRMVNLSLQRYPTAPL